ncbi:UDP-N-acetylmuramoyl-L-alanyl-D-glutamate--2,6-diaminopimelate ligase [Candidatus Westeberhardia cardiocondylae]|uniref:UDP-N-acetylmuramoyl-L-alanyl-D-glutamate--2,6-diaminopimelate ligase n=1 Tax=Candidatus Westeberhardia cardiocondylae TaxID=1594731 RepID=A0A0H5BWN9_9ENTR|nr:UDP-N-acetylmuramoyl-L-alanyl-D-glutamate--2,6-diaminopimelate ligase [Candidatus Westeberhardia cardiocondylae]MCR3756275.1 UDP-N-acetylmuramoyl-L-alanyl-D-glutamate--2, 6-diaminopimelate ligase [Candidatus Westeberhardia cardiocondylae]CEN32115.1 UDP-N-acetylmuramoyl-L-alanyl-D-glutamate--2,6-diaminopimelate ligase [Candidatus Westeberhardia cardiocondylae]
MKKILKINQNLKFLLSPWINNCPNYIFKNIISDSRIAKPQDLFIAIPGSLTDGRNYISQAIKKNVSAILAEKTNNKKHGEIEIFKNIPIIYFSSLNKNLSKLAGRFYNNPSHSLFIIGITGTNGKTTISHLLSQWVNILGKKSAVMGTMGNGVINKDMDLTKNTTDSSIYIQKFLLKLKNKKVNFVSMEVSSHALSQYRVDGLQFNVAIFTNISHDHLDYHNNMLNYTLAKWRLFSELKIKKYIINANDKIGQRWLFYLQLKKQYPYITAVSPNYIPSFFSLWKGKWIYAKKIQYNFDHTCISFKSSWGHSTIYSPLIGKCNVDNILLTIATLLSLGYSLKKLLNTSKQLQPIDGRMEIFYTKKKPIVLIDYAHTPDALKKTLITARYYCKTGKIWCIFGCGGNRDKKKRPIMGNISEKYSDKIIITDDNPRNEKPKTIAKEIRNGIKNKKKIKIIHNRIQAIHKTVKSASSNDLIVLAGKGNEKYQIIKNKYHIYSEKKTIQKLLGKLK